MNAPSSLTSLLGHRLGQSHDVVAGLGFDLVDPISGHDARVGDIGDRIIVLGADAPELAMSPYKRSLDIQLTSVSALSRPDLFGLFATVSIVEW